MDTNEKYIGVFDSGLGGLTVVKSIIEKMPHENIVYFGDTAHVPYGTRSKEQITEYALLDVRFLTRFDLKAIVIACNTADSIARASVEENYPHLPVFGVVDPASAMAAGATRNGRIGVIATNATVSSRAYENSIAKYDSEALVFSLACPLLVPLVEEGRFHKGDKVIQRVLYEYLLHLQEQDIDTLVLGCTHYPLLIELIADIMGEDVTLISSSGAAAEAIYKKMKESDLLRNNGEADRKYFVSDNAVYFEQQAKIFMGDVLTMPVLHESSENCV